jgi:hypothetical protein
MGRAAREIRDGIHDPLELTNNGPFVDVRLTP